MKTAGSASWSGGIKDGRGTISSRSGALHDVPYGFVSRFENRPGSNPEELIGSAQAACFTMALALALAEMNLKAASVDTTAEVTLERQADGFAITAVHVVTRARVPGATSQQFIDCAHRAKATCPVSRLLRVEVTLDAALAEG